MSVPQRSRDWKDAIGALAPGARVVIRDEEWMVRSAKAATYGGLSVRVVGTSELVRGKDAIFLSELDHIQELRPEETQLVHDPSPQYRRSRLYLDALLRRSPATDTKLRVGHRAAIKHADYQLQPATQALRQPRPRMLIADGVGLGKTIEVGVLLSELIQRGRGNRILVVALKSILSQFQKELWARFTIPLVRLDSVGIQRVQSRIPSNMNPFYYYDRVVISIDTLKKDSKYRQYLEQCHWDVVVVDECQHVAVRTRGGSSQMAQRARLAQLLGRTSDGLILTSATPHDGRAESFASLMNLLEPTAIADPSNYTADEVEGLFIRRFKKDIAHQVEGNFPERELELVKESASAEEDAVFRMLSDLEFKTIARERGGKGVLFRTLLLKAFLSSPAACLSTVRNRLAHKALQDETDEKVAYDRALIEQLTKLIERVEPASFRKFQSLLATLKQLGFDRKRSAERMVIFSERIDTLQFLKTQLRDELGLTEDQVTVFHGTLDDKKQQGLVKRFGIESSPIRILLCSDAASEGINLHYHCHRMVHFDLPWSLITLEQRNGRIDRFGQTETPEISYLLTIPSDEEIAGDLRVLERLIEKEDSAHKNLGDVAWLMQLHDAEQEEERIARGIEQRETPEAVIPDEEPAVDFMALLAGEDATSGTAPEISEPLRLMSDDLSYARAAFEEALGPDESQLVEWEAHADGLTLYPPDDLKRRFDYLPSELRGQKEELRLTVDRDRVMNALEKARQDERKWPEWQLLWEQHPVAEWLDDRVLAKFDRHEAPVLRLPTGVESGERIVLFQGVISNQRSQPVIVDWFGVHVRGGELVGTSPLSALIARLGLAQSLQNSGGALSNALEQNLSTLLPRAVEHARQHMGNLRNTRAAEVGAPLRDGLRRVKQWYEANAGQFERRQLELAGLEGGRRTQRERRLEREREEVTKRYRERVKWIEQSMLTVRRPFLRVAAVFIAAGEQ